MEHVLAMVESRREVDGSKFDPEADKRNTAMNVTILLRMTL